MNNLLKFKTISLNGFKKTINKTNLRLYSTQTAVKTQDEKDRNNELLREFERISNISIKVRSKQPQKPPFMKNTFLGVFDTDILAYPQLEKEDLENLNKELEPVQSYFDGIADQKKSLNLFSDFAENLRNLKLFGLQGSQLLNARELNVTESCRFNDILSTNTSTVTGLLNSELLGFQAILKNGSEEQKKKYLPQLIEGKSLSAFCMLEEDLKDPRILNTKAALSSDQKTWILNGNKVSVINGGVADLFIVIANTEHVNRLNKIEEKATAFLVEKGFGSITTEPCEALGIEGTNICNVKFDNVPVPDENILGKRNDAENVLSLLLTEMRLSSGPACSGILKTLMKNLVDHCISTNNENESIAWSEYVQSVIADITSTLYGIESITYLTAGLLDQYENQDCEMEALITKVFSTEQTCRAILRCMELIGPATYMKDHWCNKLYRDALSHRLLHESNYILKMNIALSGLKHAGLGIQDLIKKVRNPLYFPSFIFKRMWLQRRHRSDNPKLTLNLPDYVHPSCVITAEMLEYCILRLQFATEVLLSRYGQNIVEKHMDLERLSECAIDIYVMTACLARASRSYCIGLRNANYELLLANVYCSTAMERIKRTINNLYKGPYASNDDNFKKIADTVFHCKKYFPDHPLARNF